LLWREQEDFEGKMRYTGNDAMIIGKNRNGPSFEIAVTYEAKTMVWRELDHGIAVSRDGKAMAAQA